MLYASTAKYIIIIIRMYNHFIIYFFIILLINVLLLIFLLIFYHFISSFIIVLSIYLHKEHEVAIQCTIFFDNSHVFKIIFLKLILVLGNIVL